MDANITLFYVLIAFYSLEVFRIVRIRRLKGLLPYSQLES